MFVSAGARGGMPRNRRAPFVAALAAVVVGCGVAPALERARAADEGGVSFDSLRSDISAYVLGELRQSLLTKADQAEAALREQHRPAAIDDLDALGSEVDAQRGLKVTEQGADAIDLDVRSLVDRIECPPYEVKTSHGCVPGTGNGGSGGGPNGG